MTYALVVITDGRKECLERTLDAAHELVTRASQRVIVNDLPDPDWSVWLEQTYRQFTVLHSMQRRGFCGAIQAGWAAIGDVDHVFHLEDDFVIHDVDLDAMASVLRRHPHLAQVALKRQPWNPQEVEAGGIVEMWPAEYTDRTDGRSWWAEHDLFFTTNPSLYRKSLLELGWPDGPRCEERFTDRCRDAGLRFAFWGRKTDPPRVTHIGETRVGNGY